MTDSNSCGRDTFSVQSLVVSGEGTEYRGPFVVLVVGGGE